MDNFPDGVKIYPIRQWEKPLRTWYFHFGNRRVSFAEFGKTHGLVIVGRNDYKGNAQEIWKMESGASYIWSLLGHGNRHWLWGGVGAWIWSWGYWLCWSWLWGWIQRWLLSSRHWHWPSYQLHLHSPLQWYKSLTFSYSASYWIGCLSSLFLYLVDIANCMRFETTVEVDLLSYWYVLSQPSQLLEVVL